MSVPQSAASRHALDATANSSKPNDVVIPARAAARDRRHLGNQISAHTA